MLPHFINTYWTGFEERFGLCATLKFPIMIKVIKWVGLACTTINRKLRFRGNFCRNTFRAVTFERTKSLVVLLLLIVFHLNHYMCKNEKALQIFFRVTLIIGLARVLLHKISLKLLPNINENTLKNK